MCFFPCLCSSLLDPTVPLCSLNPTAGQSSSLVSFYLTCLYCVNSDAMLPLNLWIHRWVNATKFLTGASAIGSIAIPAILKHAGVIGWGALALELSSFFIIVLSIMCYIGMSDDDEYRILWDISRSMIARPSWGLSYKKLSPGAWWLTYTANCWKRHWIRRWTWFSLKLLLR